MYDLIKQYATIMYNRNLKSFGTIITVNDIINEVFAIGYSSESDVVKIVRDVIFKEKRRLIVVQQQHSIINVPGEKICNKCHESKPFSEFYKRFDKRNGFRYLNNNCMGCEKDRRSEYNLKKREERNEKKRELVRYDLQY